MYLGTTRRGGHQSAVGMGTSPVWLVLLTQGLHLSRMRVMIGADASRSRVRAERRIQTQRGMTGPGREESHKVDKAGAGGRRWWQGLMSSHSPLVGSAVLRDGLLPVRETQTL